MSVITLEIMNKKGLHARAAAKFVKTVTAYNAQVTVVKLGQNGEADSPPVTGSSILGLMMFGADIGSKLRIEAQGAQAEEVLAALTVLMQERFGEAE